MTASSPTPAEPTTAAHAARVAGTWAPESIGTVLGRVRLGESSVAAEATAALARASAHGKPSSEGQGTALVPADALDPVWIDRVSDAQLAAGVAAAEAAGPHAPLAGVPVAIKGNIDVAGLPTTAACPSFAPGPAAASATAVQRLAAAGAVVIGTTNLDQFATGLNGTRSPYGAPHAAGLPGRISGGSSSGSAVAVARGDVPLALGTDTAGSGRVPAALNGIVGLKPSKGLVSAAGVLPACRSLDVVSVFAADVDSAALALSVLAGPDRHDAWSRSADGYYGALIAAADEGDSPTLPLPPPGEDDLPPIVETDTDSPTLPLPPPGTGPTIPVQPAENDTDSPTLPLPPPSTGPTIPLPPPVEERLPPVPGAPGAAAGRPLRIGVPAELPETTIDPEAFVAWKRALEHVKELAHTVELVPIDLRPFYEAGAMLYGGAFVAERYVSVGAFIEAAVATDPGDTALDPTVRDIVLAGSAPSAADAFADLDRIRKLTAHAHAVLASVDALFTPTVLEHPTHAELAAQPVAANARLGYFTTFGNLLDLAVLALPGARRTDGLPFGVSLHAPAFHEHRVLELGARFERVVRAAEAAAQPGPDELLLAVGGAHMAGLPVNHELTGDHGRYLRLTRTTADYRLHVLDTPVGPRPGIERVTDGTGAPVEVELWAIPAAQLGSFSQKVPPYLSVGPITLLDGSTALGFLGSASDEVSSSRTVPSWRHFARGG